MACASTCKEGEAALSFVVTDDVSEANPLPTLTLAARKKRIKVDRNLIKTLRENDFAYGINEKKARSKRDVRVLRNNLRKDVSPSRV